MRILHTIYDDVGNPWCGGGGAVRTMEINRRLSGKHRITMVTGVYPGAVPQETRSGIRILRVGCPRSYALSRLSFSALLPGILSRMPFDLWVYGFSAFSPVLAPSALRRRCVLEFFHVMGDHAAAKRPLTGRFAKRAEVLTLRSYAHIVAISPTAARQIAEIRGDRGLHLVYTGVDRASFSAPFSEKDYILYFGRIDPYTKGIDLLLKAFASMCGRSGSLRLVLAGRGSPERQREVADLCHGLGISDRVDLRGGVSAEEKALLFGGALFTCMPSRYEGWGITAIEASAAGKAVVGTDIPGLADAVRDGETGLLVPPEDVGALAAAMWRLADEPALRRRLGKAGREWAERFTWDRVAEEQERAYEQALERRAQRPGSRCPDGVKEDR